MNILYANLVSLSGIRKGMFRLHGTTNEAPSNSIEMWPVSNHAQSISDAILRFSDFDFHLGGSKHP